MSSRVFWGFVLVLIGGLLLASNFGLVSWGVWNTVARAWPVLVVLWGLAIILRPLGRLGAVLTVGVSLLAVALVLGYAFTHSAQAPSSRSVPLAQSLEPGTTQVDLEVDFGAGVLDLSGGAPEGQLVTGELDYFMAQPLVTYTGGAVPRLRLTMASGTWTAPPAAGSATWFIRLSSLPEYRMNLKVGACQTKIDLSTLKVRYLKLSTGASESTVTFGDPGFDYTADLDFGAASVTLRVPRSVGVRVEMSTGLVGSNLAQAGFSKDAQTWTSEGYETRGSHLDIRSNGGVSSFNVDWID